MATLKGNELIGLVGPIVIKRGKNGMKVIQTKSRKYPQHKNSMKSSRMFGYGSSVACIIRSQLRTAFGSKWDPGMVNRFNTPVREVLNHCYDIETGTFNFEQDSFIRLGEFEFNIKSPLINFLWVKPTMTLDGNTLKVTIPELKVPDQFTFPKNTNVCEVRISISQINMTQALEKSPLYYTFEINGDQQIYPAREDIFEVANESLCAVAICLAYFQRRGGISIPHNSKKFNPANVIGALITPGIYVQPPTPPVSHTSHSKEWDDSSKLKF